MYYNIIYPTFQQIDGDTINEAIKNYIKYYQDINLTKLIIQDNNKYYNSIINYYEKNGHKKVQIKTYPGYPLDYNNVGYNALGYNNVGYNVPVLLNQPVLSLSPLAKLL